MANRHTIGGYIHLACISGQMFHPEPPSPHPTDSRFPPLSRQVAAPASGMAFAIASRHSFICIANSTAPPLRHICILPICSQVRWARFELVIRCALRPELFSRAREVRIFRHSPYVNLRGFGPIATSAAGCGPADAKIGTDRRPRHVPAMIALDMTLADANSADTEVARGSVTATSQGCCRQPRSAHGWPRHGAPGGTDIAGNGGLIAATGYRASRDNRR